jgi:hypothetical protein
MNRQLKRACGVLFIVVPSAAWLWLLIAVGTRLYRQRAYYQPFVGESLDDTAIILSGFFAITLAVVGLRLLKRTE